MNREILKDYSRVVIKIGTNSIMKSPTEVDYHKIDRLAFVCSTLQQEGKDVILVSSGAVGVGASALKMETYPSPIAEQQALASVGQSVLMNLYSRFFQHYNQYVGQILMTRDIIDYPNSYQNCQTAIHSLLSKNIIPIINENDAVSVDELGHCTKFGENDTLAAVVTKLVDADILIIMSDVDGLYNSNPQVDPEATLIPHVSEVDPDIFAMACGGAGSIFSTGGMETKLKAAQFVMSLGKAMIITSAANPNILFNILNGEAEGTLFKKQEKQYH
jgi:glutamate 5-kinase